MVEGDTGQARSYLILKKVKYDVVGVIFNLTSKVSRYAYSTLLEFSLVLPQVIIYPGMLPVNIMRSIWPALIALYEDQF